MELFFLLIFLTGSTSKLQDKNQPYVEEPILECILNITKQYSSDYSVGFLSEELKNSEILERLVSLHDGASVIESRVNIRPIKGLFVIPLDSVKGSLNAVLRKEFYYEKPLFLLYCTQGYNVTCQEDMEEAMEKFWKERFLNVAVLIEKEKMIEVYTYYPYSKTHCSKVGEPVKIDEWSKLNKTFRNGVIFNEQDKVRNLHGCVLHGIAKARPPDAIIALQSSGEWKLDGMGGFMLKEMERYLNFTTHISIPANNTATDEYGYSVYDGIPQIVGENISSGEKDIGFGIFSHVIYYNLPGTEFSLVGVNECFNWYGPCKAGHSPSKWDNYTKEFSTVNWIIIFTIFVIGVLMNCLLRGCSGSGNAEGKQKWKSTSVTLILFGTCLNQPVGKCLDQILVTRTFTSMWLFYCFITFSLYQASMGSFMTIPWQHKNIENLKQVLEMNFKVAGNPQGFSVLNKSVDQTEAGQVVGEITRRFKKLGNELYDVVIKRLVDDRDTVSFGPDRFQLHYSVHRSKNVKSKDPICSFGECAIVAGASPFMLKKGSPFTAPINIVTSRMLESGLLDLLWQYNDPKTQKLGFSESAVKKLTLHKLEGAFIIYCWGITLATIVFSFELLQQRMYIHNLNSPSLQVRANIKY